MEARETRDVLSKHSVLTKGKAVDVVQPSDGWAIAQSPWFSAPSAALPRL